MGFQLATVLGFRGIQEDIARAGHQPLCVQQALLRRIRGGHAWLIDTACLSGKRGESVV